MYHILSEIPIILRRQRKKIKTQDHQMFFVVDSFQDTPFYKSFANCLSWTFMPGHMKWRTSTCCPVLLPSCGSCTFYFHPLSVGWLMWLVPAPGPEKKWCLSLNRLRLGSLSLSSLPWSSWETHAERPVLPDGIWTDPDSLTAWTWKGILWARNKVMYFICYYSLLWANIWLLNTSHFLPWN